MARDKGIPSFLFGSSMISLSWVLCIGYYTDSVSTTCGFCMKGFKGGGWMVMIARVVLAQQDGLNHRNRMH
ncbi:predicted protein [Sclerotinia sclerotiorum 1980 UF-70]|uniref:Uncharacterized protein n=1 Tax=Sclerotinia sclerotiorum (strain ATCC 18683 / 1980 / Ss-1) TaxID=665079 RepID=A7ELC8_SCLS1|nr:predicted protein [Sclerotinia sclerotiorum 1980 UF-70]EDO03644.1 predicted protein [Sclerotinia sclerotiorum 1980 UF-70]